MATYPVFLSSKKDFKSVLFRKITQYRVKIYPITIILIPTRTEDILEKEREEIHLF